MAQRLVRTICPRCKEEYAPSVEENQLLGVSRNGESLSQLWRGAGCRDCLETGYLGRTGIYELLLIDETVREQIASGARASEIKRHAVGRGLRTLRSDAIDKVLNGVTTVEEIHRMTQMDAL